MATKLSLLRLLVIGKDQKGLDVAEASIYRAMAEDEHPANLQLHLGETPHTQPEAGEVVIRRGAARLGNRRNPLHLKVGIRHHFHAEKVATHLIAVKEDMTIPHHIHAKAI
mmetsp:Transcript_22467/g.33509  ORF Transcript_22467/g.33509 Transcript_22467/m.33509 type:complete len:111 (-) Transcript_22467:115-447(-)